MKITKEITPFKWLEECSWECHDLIVDITTYGKEDAFNSYVEEYFNGQLPSETELNDFCRFNYNEIIEALIINNDKDYIEEEDN